MTIGSTTKRKGSSFTNRKSEHETKMEATSVPLRRAIQQARSAKGLSQKELAQRLGVRHNVIAGYESGSVVPSMKFVATMEKVLGTRLPRQRKKRVDQ